jgi:hypothetical protein
VGQEGIDVVKLKWDLRLTFANFFMLFLTQQGCFYPIPTKVGGSKWM